MIRYFDENGNQIFPIDRNHPEDSELAVDVSWPTGLTERGKRVIKYFENSAFLYYYKGNFVITDESGDLTDSGDGEASPLGGPRMTSPNYSDVKLWIEEIGQEFDDAEAAGEVIPGWDETKERTNW